MNYTVFQIYSDFGQYDRVATVVFREKTSSYQKYGDSVTGFFHYTIKERKSLERSKNGQEENLGTVIKFKDTLFYKSQDQKKDLLRNGFEVSDISYIMSFYRDSENLFISESAKKVPVTNVELKVDFSDVDSDLLTLNTHNMILNHGGKLCPFEHLRCLAIVLRRNYDGKITDQNKREFLDPETGEVYADLEYTYLTDKFFKHQLTDIEMDRFKILSAEDGSRRADLLLKELKKSNEKIKLIGKLYKEKFKYLYSSVMLFEPIRLSHGKFPVWLDLERFIHIYARHVMETQIGDRFQGKTLLKYDFKEIKLLIEQILKDLTDEIEEHFQNKPNEDFKRHGEMSVYYNGDYYSIHIDSKGRLIGFYPLLNHST